MLDEAPHTLYKLSVSEPQEDEYGRQISEGTESWTMVAACFCHDNSQMKQVSVNGELWTYAFHVVYEGSKIPLGTMVECFDADGNKVGKGEVVKNAECYSEDLKGRCDLWLG